MEYNVIGGLTTLNYYNEKIFISYIICDVDRAFICACRYI